MLLVHFARWRKDDHIIQVNLTCFPFDARQYDIGGPLESTGSVSQSEEQSPKLVNPKMGRKCRFLANGRVHRDLSITTIAVQCRQNHRLSERVNTLVHPR
jgi:hypothetical protein